MDPIVPSIWINDAIMVVWWAFLLYWLASAFGIKRARARESIFSRLSYAVPTAFGVYMVFASRTPFTSLEETFAAGNLWLEVAGAAVTLIGVALAIWARVTLGRNWSGSVTIKHDHELISAGPYARFRHPIYSGLLFALLGTAVAFDRWRCLLGWAIAVVAITYKAKKEERVLTQQFGEAFDEHRRRTGFLLPKIASRGEPSKAAQA
jgi:protein-S-isoprenylcysteine O-methyltransferase Ste14